MPSSPAKPVDVASAPTEEEKAHLRPALPVSLWNENLRLVANDLTVKYQTIVREGNEIIVGRVKVPTINNGHAFILRRYDTGAVSLTTMFKACFPGAPEADEKAECDWVKNSANNEGANGGKKSSAVKLAGYWITADNALKIAIDYDIVPLIKALTEASPDPEQQYRKSQRSAAAAGELPNAKRTRVSSETPIASSQPSSPPSGVAPALSKVAEVPTTAAEVPTEEEIAADHARRVAAEKELEESRRLVQQLKEAEAEKAALREQAVEAGIVPASPSKKSSAKRTLETEEAKTEGEAKDENEGELEEGRVIATNRRAAVDPPRTALQTIGQAAWGVFVFGVGVGATTILPRFFF